MSQKSTILESNPSMAGRGEIIVAPWAPKFPKKKMKIEMVKFFSFLIPKGEVLGW